MRSRTKSKVGLTVALALGLVALAIVLPFALTANEWDGGIRLFAIIIGAGIPPGMLLGWRFAPRVGEREVVAQIAWMALSAVLLGVLEISALMVAGGLVTGHLEVLALWPLIYAVGLFLGLFVLPITLVAAVVWYFAYRIVIARLYGRTARDPGSAGVSGVVRGGSV